MATLQKSVTSAAKSAANAVKSAATATKKTAKTISGNNASSVVPSNSAPQSLSGAVSAAAAATKQSAANNSGVNATTQAQSTAPYVPGAYNDADLRAAGLADPIDRYKAMWAEGKAANDAAKMAEAHALAEQYRDRHGAYSGGVDGSQYLPTPQDTPASAWNAPYRTEKDQSAITLNAYDDSALSDVDKARILQLKQDYMQATTAEERARLNAEADKIRRLYGYSLGRDGATFSLVPQEEDMLPKTGVPAYEAQVDAVNQVYDKLNEATLAQLLASYNNSRANAEYQMGKLPALYQAQRNASAADNEREKAAFREQAAASGLNTGNRSQAALAFSNQLQNSLGQLNTAEANALSDAQFDLTRLYNDYQQQISAAVAQSNYQRAAELMNEYRAAQESRVNTAIQQANLDLSVADFNRQTRQNRVNTEQQRWQNSFDIANLLGNFGIFDANGAGISQYGANAGTAALVLAAQNPEMYYILKSRGYI